MNVESVGLQKAINADFIAKVLKELYFILMTPNQCIDNLLNNNFIGKLCKFYQINQF